MTAADLAPCLTEGCDGIPEAHETRSGRAFVLCLTCSYTSGWAPSVTAAWARHNTLSRRAALFPEALELLRSESRIWDGDRMLCGCCREPLPERTSSLGGSIPGDCVTPDCDVSGLLKRAAEIAPEVPGA